MSLRRYTAPLLWLCILIFVLLINAWVVDDAYITFRTVDNFVNGRGLTWNPGERVQAYTHPLWMFLVSLFYAATSELFFTVIILSLIISLIAVLIPWASFTGGLRRRPWRGTLLIVCLFASKAVMDYTSSGLENCLSYLIATIFIMTYIGFRGRDRRIDERRTAWLYLLASLAFLNRPDSVLLYVPVLLYALWQNRRGSYKRLVPGILLAVLPAVLWIGFSIVYYGFPFPNTAYAKVICTGFPLSWKVQRGLAYLVNGLMWDTASFFIFIAAAWLYIRRRQVAPLLILAGAELYIAFTVFSAASATHMSGRFFALPLFVGVIMLVRAVRRRRTAVAMSVLLVIYIAVHPLSSVKFGGRLYRMQRHERNCIDTKWYVSKEGGALLNWRPGRAMPNHEWYHYGESLRDREETVFVGGAFGGEAVGYACFAAGPDKYFIDRVALTDPFLARLPAVQPERYIEWKSGHFHRVLPAGYVDSVRSGDNQIWNLALATRYELTREIVSGPLFSRKRLDAIVIMNTRSCY